MAYYSEDEIGCCAGEYAGSAFEPAQQYYYDAPSPEQVGDWFPDWGGKWADHKVVRRDADRLAKDIDALNAEIVAKPVGDEFARAWARWVINWDAFKLDLDNQSDFYLFWTAGSWGDRIDRFEKELKNWREEYKKRGGQPITPDKPATPIIPGEIKDIVREAGQETASVIKWVALGAVAVAAIYGLSKVKR